LGHPHHYFTYRVHGFKEVLKLNPNNDEATIYLKRMVE